MTKCDSGYNSQELTLHVTPTPCHACTFPLFLVSFPSVLSPRPFSLPSSFPAAFRKDGTHHTTEVPESPPLTARHLLTYSPSLLSFSLTVELDSQGFPPTSHHPQKRSRRGVSEPAQDLEKGLAH